MLYYLNYCKRRVFKVWRRSLKIRLNSVFDFSHLPVIEQRPDTSSSINQSSVENCSSPWISRKLWEAPRVGWPFLSTPLPLSENLPWKMFFSQDHHNWIRRHRWNLFSEAGYEKRIFDVPFFFVGRVSILQASAFTSFHCIMKILTGE